MADRQTFGVDSPHKHPDFHTAKIEIEGVDEYEERARNFVGGAKQAADEAVKKYRAEQSLEREDRREAREVEMLDELKSFGHTPSEPVALAKWQIFLAFVAIVVMIWIAAAAN